MIIYEKYNYIYFISDNGADNTKIIRGNFSNELTNENTELFTLDGIKDVTDIKIDTVKDKLYVTAGNLNTEFYQLDKDLNKIQLSQQCGIDFLKIPQNGDPLHLLK